MLQVKRALAASATAVEFCEALWVIIALLTEVRIGPAVVLGHVAAEVAFNLNMIEAVLLAHELLFNAHLRERAAAAHEVGILDGCIEGRVEATLHGAIDVASEECDMARSALIELATVERVGNRLLEKVIQGAVNALVVHHVILVDTFQSLLAEALLQHVQGDQLDVHLANMLDTIDLGRAARAVHKIESDALGAPSGAEEFLDASSVEDVATAKLNSRCATQLLAAQDTAVLTSNLVISAARGLKALQVSLLSFDTTALVATAKLDLARIDR